MIKRTIKKSLNKLNLYNKVEPYLQSLARFKFKLQVQNILNSGKVKAPKSMLIEITGRCNLNCNMCYLSEEFRKTSKHMSLKELQCILEKVPPTIKSVLLTGGEPFMRPDLIDIIKLFKKKGISVHITTNGTLVNEKKVKALKEIGNVVSCGISIDGLEELHNKIRGVNFAFEKALNGAKLMNKYFITNLVCVIQKSNLEQLKDIVRLASKNRIKSVYFEYEREYPEHEINESQNILNLKNKDFEELVSCKKVNRGYSLTKLQRITQELKKIGKKEGVKVNFFPYFFEKKLSHCYKRQIRQNNGCACFALNVLRLGPNGNVTHCYAIRKNFGNLIQKDFKKIWNSKEFKLFRKNLLNNNLVPICETCLYQRILSKN